MSCLKQLTERDDNFWLLKRARIYDSESMKKEQTLTSCQLSQWDLQIMQDLLDYTGEINVTLTLLDV